EARRASPTGALEGGIGVFDAETEDDLRRIAELGRCYPGRLLWCGSGGLAQSLAHGTDVSVPARIEAPVLGIFGSDHPATTVQLSMCDGAVIESDDVRQDLDHIKRALADGIALVKLVPQGGVSRR